MTVLITADWHLNDNPRDGYRHHWQAWLRKIIKKHHIKCVVMLGDITEAKDHHSAWLTNKIVEYLDKIAHLCPIIIDRGNHDGFDPENPFFKFIWRVGGITWINEPRALTLPGTTWRCLFLPHTTNYKRDWVTSEIFQEYDWIFAHQTFEGAQSESGKILHGIPADIFRYNRVISGDIHQPQKIGPVTYVGSPYTVNFGDNFNARVLFINDNGSLQSVPYSGPQKWLLEYDSLEDMNIDTYPRIEPGSTIKIRLKIEAQDRHSWPSIRREIADWAESKGYHLHSAQPVIDMPVSGAMKTATKQIRGDEQLLRLYGKRNKIDEGTIATGMKLL
jgi:hypothetical protein